ncbi:MAG TPA: hypothetical protein VKG21_23130 [Casimicrobiaceae bacterium]|nr:hypothetical protein [Casimicrobiaceae bacterium]
MSAIVSLRTGLGVGPGVTGRMTGGIGAGATVTGGGGGGGGGGGTGAAVAGAPRGLDNGGVVEHAALKIAATTAIVAA